MIRLTGFAYSLLTTFLVQNDLVLIASILNTKIQFEKIEENSNSCEIYAELKGYKIGLIAVIIIIIIFIFLLLLLLLLIL